MNYLTDKTLEMLKLPAEQRIDACMREVFLTHPTAIAAEECAKRLVALPRMSSNPGMTLSALPGLGKSSLGQRWQKQSFLRTDQWAGKVIYIDLVKNISNLNLMKLFLTQIGVVFFKRPLNLSYRDVVLAQSLIRENNVRCVFIDEASILRRALTGTRLERELAALKGFAGQDWQLNVIISGTPPQLDKFFEEDATIMTRFNIRVATLSAWEDDYEGESFIKGYMFYMPLMQQSVINKDFLKKLKGVSLVSARVFGVDQPYCPRRTVVEVLRECCRLAIVSGQEYINSSSVELAWDSLHGKAEGHLATRATPEGNATDDPSSNFPDGPVA